MQRRDHNLIVWQKSMVLVKEIYRLTADFPVQEKYVLSFQMRKAVISIPSNIAEGAAGRSSREFRNFYR